MLLNAQKFSKIISILISVTRMDEFEEVAEESLVYFEGILGREYKEGQGMNFNVMMGIVGLSISVIQSIISGMLSNIEWEI